MSAARDATHKLAPRQHEAPAGLPTHRVHVFRQLVCRFGITVSVLALALRIAMLALAPRYGYVSDHDDFVRWGIQATDRGMLSLYDEPPPWWDIRTFGNGAWHVGNRPLDRLCNYPPGVVYLLDVSGWVFKAVGGDRLINTFTSRAVFAAVCIVADFLLAAGCAAIVALFVPGRSVLWAYAIVLLAPPVWWDSCIWGQVDSILLAPMVWMLWAMMAGRWLTAGVLLGLAAMLKPQAIVLAPIWAWAVLLHRPIRKPLAGLLAAGAVVLVISLPFTLHGGLNWLRASYVENILQAYPATTLKAFNVWYPDLLIRDSGAVDALLGVSRDHWGRLMLLAALAVGFGGLVRQRRRDPQSLLLWAAWSLLAAVMLPTRVHERYLLLALPPLIAVSVMSARWWPGTAALLIVATAQITWPLWMQANAGAWQTFAAVQARDYDTWIAGLPPEQRAQVPRLDEQLAPARKQYLQMRGRTAGWEWAFTILALAAAAYVAVMLLRDERRSFAPPFRTLGDNTGQNESQSGVPVRARSKGKPR